VLACELHDVASINGLLHLEVTLSNFFIIETLLLQCFEYDKSRDQIQTFNMNNQNTIKAILHSFCDQKIKQGK
jgi:hypothetical protein